MLTQLYGPLGMVPNSREVELLSYRQFRLLSRGYRMTHRANWNLIRSALYEETDDYDRAFGGHRSAARTQPREEFDATTDRLASENSDWFEDLANYRMN